MRELSEEGAIYRLYNSPESEERTEKLNAVYKRLLGLVNGSDRTLVSNEVITIIKWFWYQEPDSSVYHYCQYRDRCKDYGTISNWYENAFNHIMA